MVAPVPAQISKPLSPSARRGSPPPPSHYPLPTTHYPLSCGHPFVFMLPCLDQRGVQIHFPATPFFSHPYKTPGGVGSRTQSSPRLSLCALCLCGKSIFFKSLRPLCRLFSLF